MFGNIFGLEKYKEENRRYASYTMRDNRKLQMSQNDVNRLLLDADPLTPTEELVHLADSLSIHQRIAFQTLVMVHKIVQSDQP